MFALDTVNEKFKVPLLKDVYIKAGDTPSMFGAESLPNIKGGMENEGAIRAHVPQNINQFSGAFYRKTTQNNSISANSGSVDECYALGFDASRSSSTYQDGAKVQPDHVVYRAYVVLYSSAAEASVAQASEFMTALGGKANVGLDNVTPAQSFKDMSIGWGIADRTAGIDISSSLSSKNSSWTPPANGMISALVLNNNYVYVYTESGCNSTDYSKTDKMLININGENYIFISAINFVEKDVPIYAASDIANNGKIYFYPFKGANNA